MKLVIIEDQILMRELLAVAFHASFRNSVIHFAGTRCTGIALCLQHQPDIILLEVALSDGDGLEIVPTIRAISPDSKILVVSSHVDEYTLHRAFAVHLNGFVDKNVQGIDSLHEAIRSVLKGEYYASPSIQEARARMRSDTTSFVKVLSDREMQLLRFCGYGKSNEEIGALVGLKPCTVRNHRHNIMTKLDIKSTPQLVRYAIEKGFTRGQIAHG